MARRLARDGLLVTLAETLEVLGPAAFADANTDTADRLQCLKEVGLPVDLLSYFHPTGGRPMPPGSDENSDRLIVDIARRLAGGQSAASLGPMLASTAFHFTQSGAGYRVATESGENRIGTVRLQFTRGTYWRGPGAGGDLDLARQLIEHLPDAAFVAGIEEKHLGEFLKLAGDWPLKRPGQLTVLPQPLPVSQWAQDNGKAGVLRSNSSDHRQRAAGFSPRGPQIASDARGGGRQSHSTEEAPPLGIATLVPRYASRREDGSVFIPGETFLMDALAATGHTVIQSPLLFQGGNLLAVRDPAAGQRILLIGEAEVYRNTALGLTRRQVLEAFGVEFAVDRCIVLPAVSFHIDFDVCVRACGGRLVAFVNDSPTAARIILALGIRAMDRHGVVDHAAAEALQEDVKAGQAVPFLADIGPVLGGRLDKQGHFPMSFARAFVVDAVDSPVGNLQRFLLAMDTFVHGAIRPNERHARAYLRSFSRRAADRQELSRLLSEQGWKVVSVPSLADGNRSINYLNGIHDRRRYLMPAYGGLYAPLDEAAAEVFRRELGHDVAVIPLLCGESQRRVGAVHCSAAAYPRLGGVDVNQR